VVVRLATALVLATACGRGGAQESTADAGGAARSSQSSPSTDVRPFVPARQAEPCPVADRNDLDAALDESARRLEKSDWAVALGCAEQAARIAPRSVEAQHDRADAFAGLERWDDAKQAFAFALALDPDDPHTLTSAADFYVNRLPPSREQTEIGLEYARRGSAHVGLRREDRGLGARLALLEAQALDDLGRADEALPRAEAALGMDPTSREARYERALVLFQLCRFDRARTAFQEVLAQAPGDAFAHHHLGLLVERLGRSSEAEAHFARARALAPEQFPPPVTLSAEEFGKIVDDAVAALDPAMRRLVTSQVTIEVADLPATADLTSVEPPFPPTILGLYRGAPIGEPSPEPRAILVYRLNLARAVTTRDELVEQVRVTVLHEIGHFFGADEDDLRERGLE
jgi:predicted Zn-dependent protease with MMP-like domain/Flp pilus assembly protein TadD